MPIGDIAPYSITAASTANSGIGAFSPRVSAVFRIYDQGNRGRAFRSSSLHSPLTESARGRNPLAVAHSKHDMTDPASTRFYQRVPRCFASNPAPATRAQNRPVPGSAAAPPEVEIGDHGAAEPQCVEFIPISLVHLMPHWTRMSAPTSPLQANVTSPIGSRYAKRVIEPSVRNCSARRCCLRSDAGEGSIAAGLLRGGATCQ